jgi:arylsulfatase
MKQRSRTTITVLAVILTILAWIASPVAAQDKPNIVVIMGDDIGWSNIGAYHRGIMSGKTPNIDRLAKQGMMFTDYYAEASCTAGRANFITGELPIRTGLTTVGMAGSTLGFPDAAPTIATVLKSMGYATGQFGKNHLGDQNHMLPTMHGFDEYFGWLYHLDAMEDPYWGTKGAARVATAYPPEMRDVIGPRHMVHSWATDVDDKTVQKRWGKIGKQRIVDEGPLPPDASYGTKYNQETIDNTVRDMSLRFMEDAHKGGKPFFVWVNPARMHVYTHLSDKYWKLINDPKSNYGLQEAGMAEFDDIVGAITKKLKDMGVEDNTIIIVTTDNGAEVMSWPDGGMTPFKGEKGMSTEGGFRSPAIVRWPGKIPADTVQNGIMSGMDWFPTLVAAAGNPNIIEELKKGKKIGGKKYKVHLDGYDQTNMLTKGGESNREEIWYFTSSTLGAVRIGHWKYVLQVQPDGWFGPTLKENMPRIYNLGQDPYEKAYSDSLDFMLSLVGPNMWRGVFLQQKVAKLGESLIAYPPMQEGASFGIDRVKEKIKAAINNHRGN